MERKNKKISMRFKNKTALHLWIHSEIYRSEKYFLNRFKTVTSDVTARSIISTEEHR
jgi:hypothetical protein